MKKQISTDAAPQAAHILSQGIESNGLLFVSGQIHNTADGSLIEGSVGEKLAQIMKNIDAILAASGSSLDNCVSVTIYVTDMGQMPELNEAYGQYFTEPLPVRAAIGVQALPLGATIEISVVATA